MKFYCFFCCHNSSKTYYVNSALERIYDFVSSNDLTVKSCKAIAWQERLLMATHNVSENFIPPFSFFQRIEIKSDLVSTNILRQLNPAVFKSFTPSTVVGDGNCLYGTLSMGLFGNNEYHVHLRYLMMLEILENSNFYNMNLNDYEDLIKDSRIITPNFHELCRSVSCCGSYADMICVYASSAVICKPLKVFMPSTGPLDDRSNAYSGSVFLKN